MTDIVIALALFALSLGQIWMTFLGSGVFLLMGLSLNVFCSVGCHLRKLHSLFSVAQTRLGQCWWHNQGLIYYSIFRTFELL